MMIYDSRARDFVCVRFLIVISILGQVIDLAFCALRKLRPLGLPLLSRFFFERAEWPKVNLNSLYF